jgi:tetratricopeptide (TPR) repeat protein
MNDDLLTDQIEALSQDFSDDGLLTALRLYGELLVATSDAGAEPTELGPLHYRMGQLHDRLRRFSDAEMHYRAAVYCFAGADMPRQKAKALLLLGEVQVYLGYLLDDALLHFEEALAIAQQLGDGYLQAAAYYDKGHIHEEQLAYDEALMAYRKAQQVISSALDSQSALALEAEILASIDNLQLELVIRRALKHAERIHRKIETPIESAPGDEGPGGLPEILPPVITPRSLPRRLPGDPEAGRIPEVTWPRKRR